MSSLIDAHGRVYELGLLPTGSMPVLRWLRDGEPVTLRDVVGALECYEPMRTTTAVTLDRYWQEGGVSCTIARAELDRVLAAEVVLNRGLREAVLASPLSMSVIAMRCGRFKRDRMGGKGMRVEPRTVEVDVEQDVEIEDHWCSSCLEQVTTGPDRVCPWCETPCVEFSVADRSAA